MKLTKRLSSLPIFLAFLYLTLFSFKESQIFADYYYIIKEVDNFLFCVTLCSFTLGGFKYWSIESLRCFSIVVLLNILTEVSRKIGFVDYTFYYQTILYFFCATFVLTLIFPPPRGTKT